MIELIWKGEFVQYKPNVFSCVCKEVQNEPISHPSGGSKGATPAQNFFNFMGLFRKCVKYIALAPPSKGLPSLLRQVLDPPLHPTPVSETKERKKHCPEMHWIHVELGIRTTVQRVFSDNIPEIFHIFVFLLIL